MINFCMATKEYQKYGELSTAMLLVCSFQFLYVADCLFYEVSEDAIKNKNFDLVLIFCLKLFLHIM